MEKQILKLYLEKRDSMNKKEREVILEAIRSINTVIYRSGETAMTKNILTAMKEECK